MRIVFASDIHGNAACARLLSERVFEHEASMLALLGDYMYHGPRNPLPPEYDPAGVATILNRLKHVIVAVRGNCDSEVDQMLCEFSILSETAVIALPGAGQSALRRIVLAHGHRHGPDSACPSMPPVAPGDILARGHTHIPQAEMRNGLHCWNPGSAALPKDGWPPSYGLYADGVFSVRALDSGQILMEDRL